MSAILDTLRQRAAEVKALNARGSYWGGVRPEDFADAADEIDRLRGVMLDGLPCDGEPDHNSEECDHCRWQCEGLCLVTAQPAALADEVER